MFFSLFLSPPSCPSADHTLILLAVMAVTDVTLCLLRRDLGPWQGAMLLADTTALCLNHPTCAHLLQQVARDGWTGTVAGKTGLALTIAVRLALWLTRAARRTSVKGRGRRRRRRRKERSKGSNVSTHLSPWEIQESLSDLSIDSDDSKCTLSASLSQGCSAVITSHFPPGREASHKSWLQTVTDMNLLGHGVSRESPETSEADLTGNDKVKGRPLLRPSRLTCVDPQPDIKSLTDTLCALEVHSDRGGAKDRMSREGPQTGNQPSIAEHKDGLKIPLSAWNKIQEVPSVVRPSRCDAPPHPVHRCSCHCIVMAALAGSVAGNIGLISVVLYMHYT